MTTARAVANPRLHETATSPWPQWLMTAFALTTVLAPAAPFNKVFFLWILGWLFHDLVFKPRSVPIATVSPLIAIAIFGYGLALSLMGTNDRPIALQYFTSTLVLLLYYFVDQHRVRIDDIVVTTSIGLVAGMVLFWLSIFWREFPGMQMVFDFFDSYNFSAATDREFFDGGVTFTLQLGTTPFLLIGSAVLVFRLGTPRARPRDLLWLSTFIAATLLSGLRGLLVVSAVLYAGVLLYRARPMARIAWTAVTFAALALAYLALRDTLLFSSEEVSNAVKIGHYESFFTQLNLVNFLFGQGLGSYYFSTGSGTIRSYTELTPFDIARYIGVPLTLLLYGVVIFPFLRFDTYLRNGVLYLLLIGLFILMSLTNPVMFNSYGMLTVVWYWTKLADERRQAMPHAATP